MVPPCSDSVNLACITSETERRGRQGGAKERRREPEAQIVDGPRAQRLRGEGPGRARPSKVELHIPRGNLPGAGEDEAEDDVSQLADVPGPGIARKGLKRPPVKINRPAFSQSLDP